MNVLFNAPIIAVGIALAALSGGCANVDADRAAPEAKAQREYRTGSNIPVKGENAPATPEERERAAEQIRAIQRTGSSGKPGQ